MANDPSFAVETSPEPAAESVATAASVYAEGLKPRDPLFLLALRIFRCELDVLRANLRPARALPLPQEIHQSRIALRRLRVALSVFRDFTPAQVEQFRVEFRWLAQALGEVRDLDVYEETLAGEAGAAAVLPALLKRSIAQARRGASSRLVTLLGSKRFAGLLVAFAAFVDSELPSGVQRRWRSLRIRDAIEGDLQRSLKRVLKAGRKIDAEAPPEVLHELRIRAKRLRYETEFYAGFSADLGELTRGAKQLQDLLGAHRDALAAAERLRELSRAVKRDAKTTAAIAPMIRSQNERAAELRRRFPQAWRKFEKTAAKTKRGGKRG
jgi:CHAD domain-containing protein